MQRQLVVTRKFDTVEQLVGSIKESSELMKAVMALHQKGIAIEAAGQVIDTQAEEA